MFNSAFNSFSFHFTYKGLCEKLTAENGRDIKENEKERVTKMEHWVIR